MEIKGFLEARITFEQELAEMIQLKVSEFEVKTGLTPENIRVVLMDIREISAYQGRKNMVQAVETTWAV